MIVSPRVFAKARKHTVHLRV